MHRDQVPDRGGGVAWMGIKREPASAAIIHYPSVRRFSFFLSFSLFCRVLMLVCVEDPPTLSRSPFFLSLFLRVKIRL